MNLLKYVFDRFFGWMTHEPFIGLLMIIAALVLFLTTYKNKRAPESVSFWPWLRGILEAFGVALLFLGLLWSFRAILNHNSSGFQRAHGRVSQANFKSLKTIWGAPHIQRELSTHHTIEKDVKEEIPRKNPAAPPLYRTVRKRISVEQNSILGARGEARLRLNKRKKGSAFYSGYELEFSMEYEIINDSDLRTKANFYFPLNSKQTQFKDLRVLENGKDLSRILRVNPGGIGWVRFMKPRERLKIGVSYKSRGVEYFYYQIPRAREIKNFSFRVLIDKLPLEKVNYPDGCLTPDKKASGPSGWETALEWKLDRAITTAGMGIALPKPEQPGAKTALVLKRSPYALMLLVASICLSLIILGRRINFLEIGLLSAVYCLLFLAMASLHDVFLGFWGSLIVGAGLSLGLATVMVRKESSKLIQTLILSLTAFFTLVYPMAGLFPDFQSSFEGLVNAGLIIYIFWIALFARLRLESES